MRYLILGHSSSRTSDIPDKGSTCRKTFITTILDLGIFVNNLSFSIDFILTGKMIPDTRKSFEPNLNVII